MQLQHQLINKNNKISFFKTSNFLFIILLSVNLLQVESSRTIDDDDDDDQDNDCLEQCRPNEYCHKGVCVDSAFLNLVLRSEEISEHNTPIDAPIRIHKYNLEDTPDYDQDTSSASASNEDDEQLDENISKKQIRKRLSETIDSLWPTDSSENYLQKRNNVINVDDNDDDDDDADDESSSSEEEDDNELQQQDSNEDTDEEEDNDESSESDEDDDSVETNNNDIILNKVNKRNIQLNNDYDDDDDSEESDEDEDENDDFSNENDEYEIKKRSTVLDDSNEEQDDSDEENESELELNFNKDGTLNLHEIPLEEDDKEQEVFQPIFAERNHRRQNARFSDEDLARLDELNTMPNEQLRRPREFSENLPPDSAYFYTEDVRRPFRANNDDDYLEVPKRNYHHEQREQASFENNDDEDDESDSRSELESSNLFASNPLERFLDSFVANDASEQESNEVEDLEDRTRIMGKRVQQQQQQQQSDSSSETQEEDEEQQVSKPTEEQESSSQESNSNEYDSSEQFLTPAQKLHTARHPTLGLIDLLTSGWNQPWASSVQVEPITQYDTIETSVPKRSHIWFKEEKTIFKPDLSAESLVEPEFKPFDRIKENLDQEQEKFIQNLYNTNQQQEVAVLDDSEMAEEQRQQIRNNLQLVSDKDASFVYLVLDKKIERHEAEDLLSFISQLTAIDSSLIKDLNVKDNSIWFRLDGLDADKKGLESFLNEITNHEQQIKHAKGLQIVSSSLINNPNEIVENIATDHQKQLASSSDLKAKQYFLITVTACASALAILITLLSVFVIKRRVYLRNKLIDELSLPKKKKFEDEECLVENETEQQSGFKRFMKRLCSGKNKKNNAETQIHTQIHDATPEKDTENILTRQSHQDYQELCRTDDFVPTHLMTTPVTTNTDANRKTNAVESNRSSTSSCTFNPISTQVVVLPEVTEEPVNNIDIDVSTGHVILAYMENHLNDKNRILKEWDDLSSYEADSNKSEIGTKYMTKNRYSNILPYDHNRVKLQENRSESDDYINASYITDDEPKSPAYIATQGPLSHTTSDFWQMVWEQNSVMIISLCRTVEYGSSKCHQYWPASGIQTYGIFEVNLVSEHVWCEDYLVRSFYLKNLSNGLSRTVTQFHFLTWPENDLPHNFKSILDFRRKLNRSYRKKSAPIIIHCNDGVGRTGTFILIDMILNKITMKGAKEIDLAATVEYLRDQRVDMLKTKNQFEFAFAVIADEVENMLKAQDEH